MLTLHRCSDRLLGPCYAVQGRPGPYSRDLRLLGLTHRNISGARERGGPGRRVPGIWLVPKRRLEHDGLLRAKLRLLFAQANGAPFAQILAAQESLRSIEAGGAGLAPARGGGS